MLNGHDSVRRSASKKRSRSLKYKKCKKDFFNISEKFITPISLYVQVNNWNQEGKIAGN